MKKNGLVLGDKAKKKRLVRGDKVKKNGLVLGDKAKKKRLVRGDKAKKKVSPRQ